MQLVRDGRILRRNLDQEKITGFVVLASERSEFTIVNIVGSFDVADIEKLSTQFRNSPHHYHRDTPPRS